MSLKRSLKLRDLILYGIVVIQPVAPMSVFGVLSEKGRGHVVTAILIAMVAMLFTGVSYGRMARAYPSAGSAFTYVAREISPFLGYVVGWGMVMDYILNPTICTIWCSQQAHIFAPAVPPAIWKVLFASAFTLLNLRGIQSSAKLNAGMAAAMGVVIAVFFVAAGHHLFASASRAPAFFSRPFYDPATFSVSGLLQCTSLAVLTYIGFDGISTLSEEAENPRRNILLATVGTCLVIGVLSAAEVYVAQLLWPAGSGFPDVDTAYVWVAGMAWKPLFQVFGIVLLIANFGSGLAAQLGAARLLYGMGKSGALPRSFFGRVDPSHRIPRNNVLIIGAIVLAGAFALSYELGAEMLNFGALIAFMGVNLAALVRYYVRAAGNRRLGNFMVPALGFAICLALWLHLGRAALLAGAVWMVCGLGFGWWTTAGFRKQLSFDEVLT
ncbi:MAG TPA: APC family permease [Candidatus Didemnitutus sp.]|nr:APC family permease [Candidatus Didemnitutus sp.]